MNACAGGPFGKGWGSGGVATGLRMKGEKGTQ